MTKKCKCGCGKTIVCKSWEEKNRLFYSQSHYINYRKGKKFEELFGKNKSELIRKKMSRNNYMNTLDDCSFDARYGKRKAAMIRKKQRDFMLGRTFDDIYGEEKAVMIKNKLSISKKGRSLVDICGKEKARQLIDGMSNTFESRFGAEKACEMKSRISSRLKGVSWDNRYGKDKAFVIREKLSKSLKGYLKFDNLYSKEDALRMRLQRAEHIKMLKIKGKMNNRPSSFEKKLLKYITMNKLPFKFVGDGSFWIENINPDFVNTNGKKIMIETYYSYFKIKNYGSVKSYIDKRKSIVKRYGWDIIFLDELDMQSFNNIHNRLGVYVP